MPWRRFLAYDVAGALIWGVGHSFLGYVLGASYERWEQYATPVGLGLLVVLLFLIGASKFRSARRKGEEDIQGLGTDLEPETPRDQGD
jgi:membrane protein DedA with SNARE-associated domain